MKTNFDCREKKTVDANACGDPHSVHCALQNTCQPSICHSARAGRADHLRICETCTMMNQAIDFTQLAYWQQSASKNKALLRVLHETAQDVLATDATPLSLAFLEASVAAVYQQFGFIVFSPEARRLLSISQSRQTRIQSRRVLEWLDNAAYQQLADFHVLRYLDSEPDWLNLSQSFCHAVVRRIVVCRPQEWSSVGFEHFPREFLELLMRVVDLQMLGMRQGLPIASGTEVLERAVDNQLHIKEDFGHVTDLWGRAIDEVLTRVERDPLTLLAWRLEAFTTEKQILNDSSLAVRHLSDEQVEMRSLKVIALVVLMAGFECKDYGPVIADTPVTFSQLSKSLDRYLARTCEQSQMVAHLLGCNSDNSILETVLDSLINTGVELGVFQWTSVAKAQKGLLLTSLAFVILDPYRDLIESVFRPAEV